MKKVNMADIKTPLNLYKDEYRDLWAEVMETGFFIGTPNNPFIQELERGLSKYLGGVGTCVCNSGTTALIVALLVAGVSPGDEVIIPDFNFIAGVEAVVLLGARPVQVDVKERTGIIDFDCVIKAITPKTAVVMVTDLYGQFPYYSRLLELVEEHNIVVIEDGAQSFGAYHGKAKACACAHIATTSFYPVKPLGAFGEGGAVFSHTEEFINRARLIINHGAVEKYNHIGLGFNGRLNAIQAATVNFKLNKYFDKELKRRREIANMYLKALPEEITLKVINEGPSWAQFTLCVPDRPRFKEVMSNSGIAVDIHYPKPTSKQVIYGTGNEKNEVSDFLSNCVVSIPVHPYLTDEDVEYVIAAVNKYLEGYE